MLDDLNHVIDDVAREMTAASVDANLARRVAARLADADVPRGRVWTRAVFLAPIAAACVIVVAIFVARDGTRVAPAPTPIAAVAWQRTSVDGEAPVTQPPPARAPVRRQRTAPLAAVQEMNLTRIVVDNVDVAPIVQTEQIEIDPIAIARIEIPPMP
jgi:hypothetical protein